MEFKSGKYVPSPYRLFVIELSKHYGRHEQVIHALKKVSELWEDSLVSRTYKTLIKNINKDLLNGDSSYYYELGLTLFQLKLDDDIHKIILKIDEFIEKHFT